MKKVTIPKAKYKNEKKAREFGKKFAQDFVDTLNKKVTENK